MILSRKKSEKIVFPSLGISIMVIEMRGDRVRIGIDAPDEVPVHREEVWDRIQSEDDAAA